MSTKTLLSLATIALFAATAKATTGVSAGESTNLWFTASAASTDGWTKPDGCTATASAGAISVDTAADNPLTRLLSDIANTSTNGASRITITGTMTGLTLNAGAPSPYEGTLPQAAIVAVEGSPNNYWSAWHCTTSSEGAWVAMTGDAPSEEGNAAITIEFQDAKVRYGIGATPTWLTHTEGSVTDGAGWMTNGKNFKDILKVGLAGYGTFGDSNGFAIKEVTIDTSKIDKDAYGEITAETNLDEKKKEGDKLTIRQAILLGLDSPSDDPIPAPVQTSDGFLGFTISNADLDKYGTDAYVTLEVYEVDSPSADISEATPTATGAADSTVKVSPNNSGVRYYKTKIKFN